MNLKSTAAKSVILTGIILFSAFRVIALSRQSLETIFLKANIDYEEGDYEAAISQYNRIAAEGCASGNLYYNLGNAYFKKGELGKAILNYARAKQLIPRDRDLGSNYQYAKTLVKMHSLSPPRIWIGRVLDNFYSQFTVDGLTLLLCFIYGLLVVGVGLGITLKVSRIKFAGTVLILILFCGVSLSYLYGRIKILDKAAVVIQKKTEAKFEPFDRAAVHFTLYEGAEVEAITSNGQWYKVKRADNKAGWVKKTDLELI